jgi:hypothetical protein
MRKGDVLMSRRPSPFVGCERDPTLIQDVTLPEGRSAGIITAW